MAPPASSAAPTAAVSAHAGRRSRPLPLEPAGIARTRLVVVVPTDVEVLGDAMVDEGDVVDVVVVLVVVVLVVVVLLVVLELVVVDAGRVVVVVVAGGVVVLVDDELVVVVASVVLVVVVSVCATAALALSASANVIAARASGRLMPVSRNR
jgi:hypothetical protein